MREWGLTPPQWRKLPDADRDLLLAESALVCPSCGNLTSVCSQPGLVLYPQRNECYYTATRQLVERRLAEKYQAKPTPHDYHPLDGVSVWLSETDLNPDDDFFDLSERVLPGEGEAPEHDQPDT